MSLEIQIVLQLKIVKDQNDNIIEEGGVKVDLSADRVIYLNSGAEDIVSNIEFFMSEGDSIRDSMITY